jgi:hypothetical protein
MEGVDLYVVGQILRHKSPRMTQRYAHLSPQNVAAKVEKLDRVFGGVLAGETAQDALELVPTASPVLEAELEYPSKLLM